MSTRIDKGYCKFGTGCTKVLDEKHCSKYKHPIQQTQSMMVSHAQLPDQRPDSRQDCPLMARGRCTLLDDEHHKAQYKHERRSPRDAQQVSNGARQPPPQHQFSHQGQPSGNMPVPQIQNFPVNGHAHVPPQHQFSHQGQPSGNMPVPQIQNFPVNGRTHVPIPVPFTATEKKDYRCKHGATCPSTTSCKYKHPCPYGRDCTSIDDEEHFARFYHDVTTFQVCQPGFVVKDKEKEKEQEKISCRFGYNCHDRSDKHLSRFLHPCTRGKMCPYYKKQRDHQH